MAIWKDPTPATKAAEPSRFDPPPPAPINDLSLGASAPTPLRAVDAASRESVIAADIAIEGKIEGAGHVRIAGKFKGDVKVQGNLTIEQGAKVSGGVSAHKVTLAGELDGNIDAAQQVELQQTGVINGDLKAGSLTVAAGSRIRGHIECGWSDKDNKSIGTKAETGNAA